MKHRNDGDTKCNLYARYSHERLVTGTEGLGNKRTNEDYPNNRIVEIGQNTEKSSGDLLSYRLQQLMLIWKNFQKSESLLIAAQNTAIKTKHIKARIDKSHQNSRRRLCGERDETINKVISESSKLAQKEYKTRHDWVGKVIHWELCKKLKFDHTNKWYNDNPESVLKNETHKLLWDFDIQTDHLITARRPDPIIINKKKRTCMIVDFAVPADHRVEFKECEKKD